MATANRRSLYALLRNTLQTHFRAKALYRHLQLESPKLIAQQDVPVDKSAHSLVIKFPCKRRFLSRAAGRLLAVVLVAQAHFIVGAEAQTPVDLELVLAVDVSLSMDLDEQRLQRDGYVAAFRDPEIQKAITAGGLGRIAVVYMEWAGPASQSVVIPWTIVDGPDAARAFADKLEATQISRARLTSISAALKFAHGLFYTSGTKGLRRVIDVSGDGPNNSGEPVVPVRDGVVADGIVINGLPVVLHTAVASAFDIPDLDQYYRSCVIGGAGAFMIPVKDVEEFASAIRRKLLLEISGLPASVVPVQDAPEHEGYDCLIGEKRWQWYFDRIPN